MRWSNSVELGFPTTKNEEWKFTNISPLTKYNFVPSDANYKSDLSGKDIEKYLIKDLDVNLLVFVNGFFRKDLSIILYEAEKIQLGNMADFALNNASFIEKHFESMHN